jgi:large subunit ribosomal protein L9
MQVILLERVDKLGYMGQTVEVKTGFARNFLLPKKKALRATKNNIAFFESQRAQLEVTNIKRREEAEHVAKSLENVMVTLVRQASEMRQLYGSVRSQDVAAALQEVGITVARNQVDSELAIKTLGIHNAKIILHPEVSVNILVNVAQSAEEAVVQKEMQTKTA